MSEESWKPSPWLQEALDLYMEALRQAHKEGMKELFQQKNHHNEIITLETGKKVLISQKRPDNQEPADITQEPVDIEKKNNGTTI